MSQKTFLFYITIMVNNPQFPTAGKNGDGWTSSMLSTTVFEGTEEAARRYAKEKLDKECKEMEGVDWLMGGEQSIKRKARIRKIEKYTDSEIE